MFCPYCGKQLPDNAMFCKYCGKSLGAETTSASAPQQPIPLAGQLTGQIAQQGSAPLGQVQQQADAHSPEPKQGKGRPSAPMVAAVAVGVVMLGMVAFFVVASMFPDLFPNRTNRIDNSLEEPDHYNVELDDLVLYEDDDISVLAKGFVDEGERGGSLYIEVINDGEMDIEAVASQDFTVNGCMIEFIGTTDNGYTPAGESRIYAISFEDQYLEPLGIRQVATLHSVIRIIHIGEEGSSDPDVLSDPVDIVLREDGLPDEAPDGELVYDANGIRIIYIDNTEGGNFFSANFYVENSSGRDITIIRHTDPEGEYTGWQQEIDFPAGSTGMMSANLYDDDFDSTHYEIDYMIVWMEIVDSATGETIDFVTDFVVEID